MKTSDKTTPRALDHFEANHLFRWCERVFLQSQEAAETLEAFANSLTPADRAYYLAAGWRALADRYERENPDHYAKFNS